MKKKARQAVAVYDLHYDKYDKPTWGAILAYLKDNPPDVFVFGGDQFDFEMISHHTKNTPIFRTRRSYMNVIEGFKRDILGPLERVLPDACEKVWIIGNHEDWEQDLVNEQPELEGAIGHVRLLGLDQKGWNVIPLGHRFKLGKLNVIHGETLTGIGNQAGAFPAKKALELYAGNVLAGHTHAPQTFTKVSPVEHSNKWQAHIAPIAGRTNPTYLRNRPTSWLNGFVVIDVFPDGQFNLYPVIVMKGRFALGGKCYGA